MNAVGIIIVKGNSNRFPGKNIYPVNGRPMFFNNVELLKNCEDISDVYVCTDSDYIREYCLAEGVKIIWRGENIVEDEQPYFDVLKFAYQSIPYKYDLVVSVLPNSINQNKDAIHNGIEIMKKDNHVSEIRSFDDNGNQSGIFLFRESLFENFHTLAHMGIVKSNGKEIHYKEELSE